MMNQLEVKEAKSFIEDSTVRLQEMTDTVKELVTRIKKEVPKDDGFRLEEGKR